VFRRQLVAARALPGICFKLLSFPQGDKRELPVLRRFNAGPAGALYRNLDGVPLPSEAFATAQAEIQRCDPVSSGPEGRLGKIRLFVVAVISACPPDSDVVNGKAVGCVN
jgi:hypothetical protein